MNAKLFTPLIKVILPTEGDDEPKAVEVQTINADLVLWDRTRNTHKWPKFDDAPFLWHTFITWAACRRNGLIPVDMKYEDFEKSVLSIEPIDNTESNPTDAGPAPA